MTRAAITLFISFAALGACVYLACWQASKKPDFTIERKLG